MRFPFNHHTEIWGTLIKRSIYSWENIAQSSLAYSHHNGVNDLLSFTYSFLVLSTLVLGAFDINFCQKSFTT